MVSYFVVCCWLLLFCIQAWLTNLWSSRVAITLCVGLLGDTEFECRGWEGKKATYISFRGTGRRFVRAQTIRLRLVNVIFFLSTSVNHLTEVEIFHDTVFHGTVCPFTSHLHISTEFPENKLKPLLFSGSFPSWFVLPCNSCDFVLGLAAFGLNALFVN